MALRGDFQHLQGILMWARAEAVLRGAVAGPRRGSSIWVHAVAVAVRGRAHTGQQAPGRRKLREPPPKPGHAPAWPGVRTAEIRFCWARTTQPAETQLGVSRCGAPRVHRNRRTSRRRDAAEGRTSVNSQEKTNLLRPGRAPAAAGGLRALCDGDIRGHGVTDIFSSKQKVPKQTQKNKTERRTVLTTSPGNKTSRVFHSSEPSGSASRASGRAQDPHMRECARHTQCARAPDPHRRSACIARTARAYLPHVCGCTRITHGAHALLTHGQGHARHAHGAAAAPRRPEPGLCVVWDPL